MKTAKYLLAINYVNKGILEAIAKLRLDDPWKNLELVVLTNRPTAGKFINVVPGTGPVRIIASQYSSQEKIAKELAPVIENIIGVVCRGENNIQYLRKIVPPLPSSAYVASEASLKIATNKQLMRQAFLDKFPEITPKFKIVSDASETSVQGIEKEINYPVIVKPANLASSLLIQSCNSRQELQKALRKTFSVIPETYKREGRHVTPCVIVEEFLEGDLYSIDAYMLSSAEMYFCPPVAYVPAKNLGIDDFFIYKRFTDTKLNPKEISAANDVARQALLATGLTYSSAHIELIRTASGWKIIELGPRIGRLRNPMYRLGYDIDHSLNDIKLHVGLRPIILTEPKNYCAAYSIYPEREGKLLDIAGIDWLKNNPRVTSLKVFAKKGYDAKYAKNGGHTLAEFIIATPDKTEYLELVQKIETTVYARTDSTS